MASPIRLVLSAWFLLLLIWTAPATGSAATKGPSDDVAMHPYLNAVEARSDFGIVATGSPEATEAAVAILEHGGNAISLTQTLSRSFGAKVATRDLGFLYNSFLEAFNVEKPHCGGFLQPRSPCVNDMAPTIVLRKGHPVAVLGSPGSNRIPGIIATIISNMVDRGMTLRTAVAAPRIVWGGRSRLRITVEMIGPFTSDDMDALVEMGYQEVERVEFPPKPVDFARLGGVNAVACDPSSGVYSGVADPRRGGLAMGPRAVVVRD